MSHEKVIKLDHPCQLHYYLDEPHDEKSVYILYQGIRKRVPSGGSCKTSVYLCYDIYFAENVDGGESWSTPVVISRKNTLDQIDRSSPQLLMTKTGRLWIFYRLQEFYNAPYAVRPPKSTVF